MNEVAPKESGGEFLLYQTEDGRIRIETRMQEETVWLTQDQMAQLFGKVKSTINEHIKNIFKEGEFLKKWSLLKNM
jgi:hypothetical protein